MEQLEACAGPVWKEMGIEREALFWLGAHPALPGQFHMTVVRHAALGAGERRVAAGTGR